MMKTITNMSRSGLLGCFVLFALWAMPSVYADDTDIYLNPNVSNVDKPMIMLSLDYRSNLGNSVCSDDEETEDDGPCGKLVASGSLDTLAISSNGQYSSLEVYVAVLKEVMKHKIRTDNDGNDVTIADSVLLGLMMSHNNDNNCEPGDTKCSNGGFILSGFQDMSDKEEGGGYDKFFDALESIPIPQSNWNSVTNNPKNDQCGNSGSGSHSYQGAELFFEFFRYLTGQDVYFGKQGWTDFGTDDGYNLNILNDNSDNSNNHNNNSDVLGIPVSRSNSTCRPTPVWDTGILTNNGDGNTYINPLQSLDTDGCGADIYTFNFMFQVSSQEEDANCAILADAAAGGMDGIAGSGCTVNSTDKGGTFSEVLKYLRDHDLSNDFTGVQNVTSYFFVPSANQTTNAYANAGGTTKAIAMDLSDINQVQEKIEDTIEQVLTVSTTFVSPTLPSNVFNRTDLLDQVYISIFKADEDRKPRWTGNLKRLHLNTDDPTNPFLAGVAEDGGVSDDPAINSEDGRISANTLTVWTHPEDVPAPPEESTDYAEGTDGRSTYYGGAGGNIPGYRLTYEPGYNNNVGTTSEASNRVIFTEPDSRGDSTLRDFNADEATAISLLQIGGGGDDYEQIKTDLFQTLVPVSDCSLTTLAECHDYNIAEQVDKDLAVSRLLDILAYGRGYNSDGGAKRNWFMGDPLHSKPATINYGGPTEFEQVIRIAVATNDGFLHFVRESDGVEEWAFTPRSVTGVLDRLQKNVLDNNPVHPYTLDGSPVALRIDTNTDGIIEPGTDKVYLYTGMRRGGQHYYALDVTDYENPKMLWSINSDDPGFSELGQTWSTPQTIRVRYEEGGTEVEKHALIFGGGFNGDHGGDNAGDQGKDARDDEDPAFTGTDDDEGNAIFIVDAETGELIWKATGDPDVATSSLNSNQYYHHNDMVDSIPANVLAVNATVNSDHFHDRAYVGDTGGVIWRVDFVDADRSNWKVTRLASLGRHDQPGAQAHDRRFFHGTDFVLSSDNYGAFDGVVVASGNRTNPLSKITNNYLYVLKDRNTSSVPSTDSPFLHDDLQDLSDNCLQDNDASDCIGFDSLNNTLPALENGWKLILEQCHDETTIGVCGEKGLSRPLVLFGQIIFNSYVPPDIPDPDSPDAEPQCGPAEGSGQTYVIDLQDATAVDDLNSANNTGGDVVLDRSERLDSGGIPSDPVVAGQFGESQFASGVGGGTCSESIGILFPDLDINLLCSIGLMKKYWYTTEPD